MHSRYLISPPFYFNSKDYGFVAKGRAWFTAFAGLHGRS
jgi:hypothetical protein